MPIPSMVATLIIAAFTLTRTGGGLGAHVPVAMRGVAGSTPAPATLPVADETDAATRQVNVTMVENRFSPASFDLTVGETVTFVFTNRGTMVHDAFIGDKAAQEQHEKEMRAAPEGHHDHAHEGGVVVQPGESGTLQYVFDKPGTLEIGCHQPNHYEAGMIAVLNVKPA